jgi:pimeloyl-ACP methyl ester carboxylesterase
MTLISSAHGSRATNSRIVIIHPSSPVVDAWRPVELELRDRGFSCEVITWLGWVGELPWKRGEILKVLGDDAVAKLRPGAGETESHLMLVGHHVGARLARMLAEELDAAAVVELSAPSRLSWVVRLASRAPGSWILAAVLFGLPNRWRSSVLGRAYGRVNFAADPPGSDVQAFVDPFGVRREAVELVRRWTALHSELDRSPEPPIARPTLSLRPTGGRITTGSADAPRAVTVALPGGHSAHVEHPALVAALIAEWAELLLELPPGSLGDNPIVSERLGRCVTAYRDAQSQQ